MKQDLPKPYRAGSKPGDDVQDLIESALAKPGEWFSIPQANASHAGERAYRFRNGRWKAQKGERWEAARRTDENGEVRLYLKVPKGRKRK